MTHFWANNTKYFEEKKVLNFTKKTIEGEDLDETDEMKEFFSNSIQSVFYFKKQLDSC